MPLHDLSSLGNGQSPQLQVHHGLSPDLVDPEEGLQILARRYRVVCGLEQFVNLPSTLDGGHYGLVYVDLGLDVCSFVFRVAIVHEAIRASPLSSAPSTAESPLGQTYQTYPIQRFPTTRLVPRLYLM
jgi:hypothetical protein